MNTYLNFDCILQHITGVKLKMPAKESAGDLNQKEREIKDMENVSSGKIIYN